VLPAPAPVRPPAESLQLSFAGETLERVALDLAGTLASEVEAAPDLGERRRLAARRSRSGARRPFVPAREGVPSPPAGRAGFLLAQAQVHLFGRLRRLGGNERGEGSLVIGSERRVKACTARGVSRRIWATGSLTARAISASEGIRLSFALLTAAEEIELARRVERGDEGARERMITSNLALVVSDSAGSRSGRGATVVAAASSPFS
jgi:Sigma-70 factor, region 1.2